MSKKDVPYVASGKDITYTMPKGIIAMLANASKKEEKDIWLILSELGNICVSRLEAKSKNGSGGSSWTKKKFPGTEIELRFDAGISRKYDYTTRTYTGGYSYHLEVKVAGYKYEKFTQKQIDDYIVEGILLGDGLEADENIETSN